MKLPQSTHFYFSPITRADCADVFATLNDRHTAEIISFLSWPMTMDQAMMWCEKAESGLRGRSDYMFIARDSESGAAAGCIGLHHVNEDGLKRAETGYWIAPGWQGKGVATALLRAIIDFGFQSLHLETIWATTALNNPASNRVLEKAGFVKTGMKNVPLPQGGVRPSYVFEIGRGF